MCFGDPSKSLAIARERMTAEQWARFEREFDDFCVVQGLPDKWAYWPTYDWAKWAFFQGRQHREPVERRTAKDAHYTHLAIAMMDDEQAMASQERWDRAYRLSDLEFRKFYSGETK